MNLLIDKLFKSKHKFTQILLTQWTSRGEKSQFKYLYLLWVFLVRDHWLYLIFTDAAHSTTYEYFG